MSNTDTASDPPLRRAFWRYAILTHRYIGIAISLIVLLWCVSGFIMMYVQYPAMDRGERLTGLAPIDLARIQDSSNSTGPDNLLLIDFAVESSSFGPILRVQSGDSSRRVMDLGTGEWIDMWSEDRLDAQARFYASQRGWPAPNSLSRVERDQWTVSGGFDAHRPMVKFANENGQEWYVSSLTGEIVQTTSAYERFWNWPGSVVHWLYPTMLRQHVTAWSQTVIWLTLLALFLTITGITIGLKQYRRIGGGRRSPYRGWALWHHYAGLIFGLFTLTWLLSGLFSMNPWGALQSRSVALEYEILNGGRATVDGVINFLRDADSGIPTGTVRLEAAYWLGRPFLIAYDRDGNGTRLSMDGDSTDLNESAIRTAASALRDLPAQIDLLEAGDSYYYSHHNEREFPVYRLTYSDGERFYISASSGTLLRFVDANARKHRWLFSALHTGDFNALARSRPIWDIMLLLLLTGVTTGVGTGTWLAAKRISR